MKKDEIRGTLPIQAQNYGIIPDQMWTGEGTSRDVRAGGDQVEKGTGESGRTTRAADHAQRKLRI